MVGLGTVATGFGAYFVARWLHFGTLLSNTATAKVEADPDRLARGLDYVVAYGLEALSFPIQLLLVPVAVAIGGVRGLVWGALAVGVPLFAVVVGGDFMTMRRLLVPGLAFQAACVGLVLGALDRRHLLLRWGGVLVALTVAAVGALPLADLQLVDEGTRRAFRVRFNSPVYRTELGQWRYMKANAVQWARLGRALGQVTAPGESIVLGAVGAASYENDLFVYDRYGLVTREVALHDGPSRRRHSPGHDKAVPVTFFLDASPTYLSAELARAGGLKAAGQALLQWRDPRVRAGWAPEIRPTRLDGEDVYVVLLSRNPRPGPVWASFASELDEVVKDARGR